MSLMVETERISDYKGNNPKTVRFYIKEDCYLCSSKAEFVSSCGVFHLQHCQNHSKIAKQAVSEAEKERLEPPKEPEWWSRDFCMNEF